MKAVANRIWGNPILLAVAGTLAWLVFSTGCYALLSSTAGMEADVKWLAFAVLLPSVFIAAALYATGKQARSLADLRRDYENTIGRDSLTSCLNSTLFSALVDAHPTLVGSRAGRRQGSFLIVDVDQLSELNRTAGQRAGDRALRAVGEIIRSSVRSDDIVGRLGGDRFGVFLPGATRENAEAVAERIRTTVSEARFRLGGIARPLGVSIGAILFEQEIDYDGLVRAAEQTLRHAKENGRNRVEYAQVKPGPMASSRPALH
ncbi:GGDEF domain-containing protein [Chelativorans sp. AA-79]|uniref:GGDEF domain-containing protein n=1 Tax=Chelativorans sp. AA-79 TaxID=3028735 RepID=UPI0023F8DE26|nr:GGDEF domain-containing protein [Chelativorans sp. AA-79]WEX07774.1 GGDEF domain-containing protein [Chelativorans sp. AA-79]